MWKVSPYKTLSSSVGLFFLKEWTALSEGTGQEVEVKRKTRINLSGLHIGT